MMAENSILPKESSCRLFAEKFFRIWIIFQLVMFSVNIIEFTGEGERNLPLYGVLFFNCLMPFFLLSYFRKKDLLFLLFVLGLSVSVIEYQDESYIRMSSFFYTLLFVNSFFVFSLLLRTGVFQLKSYITLLRYLIIAYFIVIVLQQFALLTHLPIGINLSAQAGLKHWGVGGLMTEQSHSARILFVIMYSYFTIWTLLNPEKMKISFLIHEKKILLIWTYCMLTMGSVTAILLAGLFFLCFANLFTIIWIFLLGVLGSQVLLYMKVVAVERAVDFLPALFSLDIDSMILIDHSAAVRIVPPLLYFQSLSDFSFSEICWGNGPGYDSVFYFQKMIGIDSYNWGGGMLSSFLVNYGILNSLFFIMMIFFFCIRKWKISDFAAMLLIYIAVPINTQLLWIAMMMFAFNKIIYMNYYNQQKLKKS